ncbi:MAG: 1-acyl-sn-glycerol-3-phosphate acyltransferase [Candidatus Obscuribacterales bacterium]|jgi:1-acyl-sn-glycerol-3-phosphate acyltransferase|nr:1-acyl-sn-glycerol-3-phosphate acyltransferase [Candidatus Obscuribacterales bacterium]
MLALRKKKKELADRKNIFVYAFWNLVNIIVTSIRFRDFEISGQENIPKNGPFLLVSNHCSRWDGLVVYRTLARPSNFMVSPNELRGMQGSVLVSMGAFPADPRYDLVGHSIEMFKRGQGVVVFPEGNTFYDGSTHTFKTGTAKIALASAKAGLDVPLLPAAIYYSPDGKTARICVGKAISLDEYVQSSESNPSTIWRALSDRMHREVCFLRAGLGALADRLAVLYSTCSRDWSKLAERQSALLVGACAVEQSSEELVTSNLSSGQVSDPISLEALPEPIAMQRDSQRKAS